jgi:transglutaminase-like putative cysteine protease
MKFHIEHRTVFEYTDLVSETYTEVRLSPVAGNNQIVHGFRLETDPGGEVLTYVDRFGNSVQHFNVLTPYTRLSVTSFSDVTTTQINLALEPELTPLDAYDYREASRYVQPGAALAAFVSGAPSDDAQAMAYHVMNTIFGEFKYVPGSTTVQTSAEDAIALKSGVCQDFAHAMIGVCRSHGLAARYVSGYLHSPNADARDDAASHAWVDIFVPGQGWLALDPTHNCAQSAHYVRLGVGRDYADTPPTRGTYKGIAKETLSVKVQVRAV